MDFAISITGFVALYIFLLAAFAGWVIIGRVPAILHTPLMSGSNFVHGIVVVGGIVLFSLLDAARELLLRFLLAVDQAATELGGESLGLQCDVTKPEDVQKAIADTVAAFGLHGALLIGPHHSLAAQAEDWSQPFSTFEVDLKRDGTYADHGCAANLLGGPLSALRHLVDVLSRDQFNPPLAAGEIVVTRRLFRTGESEYLLNGKICRLDLLAAAQQHGALHRMLELAHVARPRIRQHPLGAVGGELLGPSGAALMRQEVIDEHRPFLSQALEQRARARFSVAALCSC